MFNFLSSRNYNNAETESEAYTGQEEDKNEYENEYETENDEQEFDEPQEEIIAQLVPGDLEKRTMLSMFDKMRSESLFCDVSFLCQGTLLRAHRVVTSSWSRWLKGLLAELPDQEVLTLDFFEVDAFSSVLDYMYGVPLTITVETAESIIKIVRRLEMQKLEQQCWRYLMTIIDRNTNCQMLHDLADRYDCPPLKLAAWRILQETVPGYGMAPSVSRLLRGAISTKPEDLAKYLSGTTGLTGPGDPSFNSVHNVDSKTAAIAGTSFIAQGQQPMSDDEDDLVSGNVQLPSLFEEKEDDVTDEDLDDDDSRNARKLARIEDLDPDAPAKEVVKAWARHLKDIYTQCTAAEEEVEGYQDQDDFRLVTQPVTQLPHYQQNTSRQNVIANSPTARLVSVSPSAAQRGKNKQSYGRQLLPNQAQYVEEDVPYSVDNDDVGVQRMTNYGGGSGANTPLRKKPPAQQGVFPTQQDSYSPASSSVNTSKYTPGKSTSQPKLTKKSSKQGSLMKSNIGLGKIQWEEELKRFYISINLPEKVSGIPTILKTWRGQEDQMLSTLMEKYENSMTPAMIQHFESLLKQVEKQNYSTLGDI